LLDQLDIACRREDGEAIEHLLAELERYARYHFGCEELLMEAYGYPAETQQREHRELLVRLREMRANPEFSRPKIRLFVFKWLTNHIQIEDKDLGKFVLRLRQPYLSLAERPVEEQMDSSLLTNAVSTDD
jgi:hemerythrin-like metal-binding protein